MTEQVCKTVKVFEYPGAIVRVHIPELSEEENRELSMKRILNSQILKNRQTLMSFSVKMMIITKKSRQVTV